MLSRNAFLVLVATLASGFLHAEPLPETIPATSDTALKASIDRAVIPFMRECGIPGVAVGVVTQEGCLFFNYGDADEAKTPITEDTLFEVGSISKTFTATLASLAEEQGRLSLGDTVAARLEEYKGSALGDVTLLQLATQTSALPFLAPDEVDEAPEMTAWLAAWKPEHTSGEVRIYSNLGIGVLGRAVARTLDMEYTTAVDSLLLAPLGLKHTYYAVPESEEKHYAMGHFGDGTPHRMEQGLFWAEAYGIRTSASDLVQYLKAQLGLVELPPELAAAITTTQKGYFRAGPMTQALVWDEFAFADRDGIITGNSMEFVMGVVPASTVRNPRLPAADVLVGKTGASYGFGSYVAFLPSRKIGMVLLANKSNPMDARVKAGLAILDAVLGELPGPSAERPTR